MTFIPEQITIVGEIAKKHGLEEVTPGKFRGGKHPHFRIVDCNIESTEFPGLPMIAISDGKGKIQETGHGIQVIEDIRTEIQSLFQALPEEQAQSDKKFEPRVEEDSTAPKSKGEPKIVQDSQKEGLKPEDIFPEVKHDETKIKVNPEKADEFKKEINELKKSSLKIITDDMIYHDPKDKPKPEQGVKVTYKPAYCIYLGCGIEIPIARAKALHSQDIPREEWTCECHEKCEPVKEVPKGKVNVMSKTSIEPARIPVTTITQKGSMIKGFVPSLKEIGKIKIGGKGKEVQKQSGTGTYRLPVKYDHFEVVTLMKDEKGDFIKDPVMTLLEEEPKTLDIFLLFNDPTLNFVTSYTQYQGGKCLCRGDGETAKTFEGKDVECNPDTCQAFSQKKCKPNGILSVILTKSPRLGGVYKFRTTSYNSIRSILSSMFFLSNLTGGVLAMIPLKLTVSPQQVQPKDANKAVTIYVVNIEFAGTAPELLQKTFEVQKYQSGMRESIMRLEATARQVLTAPESQEEINEIEEEFYPKNCGG